MRNTRLAALTVAVTLGIAACSSASPPTPSVPPSIASSPAASITPPSVEPSVAASVAPPSVAPPSVAPSPEPSAGTGSAVTIANFAFDPAKINARVGTKMVWTNTDGTRHTVTADDGSFTSGRLEMGATFSHTFTKAGTFAYHCAVHPAMQGTVTVH